MRKKALALLVSSMLSLLLLEVCCRVYLFGSAGLGYEKIQSVRSLGLSGLIQPSEHLEIVYELKPGLSTIFKLASFRTNSLGLRDKDYSLEKPPGTFRVAVLGDSLTMASGVEIEDAYHSVLETRLSRRGDPAREYEFINFGVGGYSLRQYLGVLEHRAIRYHPDLILIGFSTATDFHVPPDGVFQVRYRPKQESNPFFQSFAFKLLWMIAADTGLFRDSIPPSDPSETKGIEYLRRNLRGLSELATSLGIPAAVVALSTRRVDDEPLRGFVEESGLVFINASDYFPEQDERRYRIYAIDPHPNRLAHRMFADSILRTLTNKGLLP